MLIDLEGLSTLWAALFPRQEVLEFIRTLAECEPESGGSFPPWFLLEFMLESLTLVPLTMDYHLRAETDSSLSPISVGQNVLSYQQNEIGTEEGQG